MTVNVRIAPSPTGNLHIGTARTALFNWLFARRNGGKFILRIEDTDLERNTKAFEENIVDGLRWLGIDWDNDVLYRQSERLDVYRGHLKRLMAEGKAVWKEFTAEEKEAAAREGRTMRDRIIVLADGSDPERELAFDDAIRGRVSVQRKHIGSLALAKDEDTPLYNFAVVVDDVEMDITHVIRGEDHISNTPKQMLIYEALGANTPIFAHLPLILAPDRSKMSKRHGATNIAEYQPDYLPEALVNFMATLGYTYDQEILTMDEMAKQFELGKVHKSGAVLNVEKLNWYNAQYIKRLTPAQFKQLIGKPDLPDAAVPVMTERLERLTDIEQFAYLWNEPTYDAELLTWKDTPPAETLRALTIVRDLPMLDQAHLDTLAAEHFDAQKGRVYWPLRVALAGVRNSAGPLDIIGVIGRDAALRRIAAAIAKLEG